MCVPKISLHLRAPFHKFDLFLEEMFAGVGMWVGCLGFAEMPPPPPGP